MEEPDRARKLSELDSAEDGGVLRELWLLLRHNKKYWMIPIIALLLASGLLIILGGSGAAPFIYRLF
jgi:hypothetical protein